MDDIEANISLIEELDEKELFKDVHDLIENTKPQLNKVKLASLLSGKLDSNDAFVTVHAGAGGTEACDWCGMLSRMYSRYATRRSYDCRVVDFTEGDGAGYRSITFEISGPFAYGYLKSEMGVHRLVRISPFDANSRRHTSFASVDVFPVIDDDIDVEIKDEDLRVDTYRASGAGGQHVNKTESAVRITHLPTKIVVQCQSERSQMQNRAQCMKMLKAKLFEREEEKRQQELDKTNAEKKAIEWGSQIRNYVLQPYQLIKDLRTQFESGNVQKVLDGDIQDYIEAFLTFRAEKN